MNTIRLIIILTIITSGFLFTNELFSIEDEVLLPKTGHRKPQILFSHRAHTEDYGAECKECHHEIKEGDQEYKKCSACHKERDQGHVINLKGAFHQQCHDCHRKTSGPKACGRCHKK